MRFIFGLKSHRVPNLLFLENDIYQVRNAKKTLKTLHNHSRYCVLLDSLLSWHVNHHKCFLRMSQTINRDGTGNAK